MIAERISFCFYLRVDTRVVLFCTPKAPGYNTLQLTITHNRTTRVTLRAGEQRQYKSLN